MQRWWRDFCPKLLKTVIIEDGPTPLAGLDISTMGDIAGIWTNGLVLTLMVAAVVGRTIRKLRTGDEVFDDEEEEVTPTAHT